MLAGMACTLSAWCFMHAGTVLASLTCCAWVSVCVLCCAVLCNSLCCSSCLGFCVLGMLLQRVLCEAQFMCAILSISSSYLQPCLLLAPPTSYVAATMQVHAPLTPQAWSCCSTCVTTVRRACGAGEVVWIVCLCVRRLCYVDLLLALLLGIQSVPLSALHTAS